MEAVHYFVRGLFRGMSETDKIAEQREELETHIKDRISDSMARGVSEREAFTEAVASLGNLDELMETMTGEKKKIFEKKAKWIVLAGAAIYGTFYMLAIGIWFSFNSFGLSAIYVALPGWLGFVIPAIIRYVDWKTHRFETSLIKLDRSQEVRSAVFGWILISTACWVANFLLFATGTFLGREVWAWMPTFGVLSWPLMEWGFAWMIRNLRSLEPDDDLA